jgi:hypothetical protein
MEMKNWYLRSPSKELSNLGRSAHDIQIFSSEDLYNFDRHDGSPLAWKALHNYLRHAALLTDSLLETMA